MKGTFAAAVGEPARSKVVMKACKPDDPAQQWSRNRVTHQVLNGKYCLEAGKSLIPGALVKVWHCDDDAVLQKWFVSGSRIDGYLNLCLNVAAEREDEPAQHLAVQRRSAPEMAVRAARAKVTRKQGRCNLQVSFAI